MIDFGIVRIVGGFEMVIGVIVGFLVFIVLEVFEGVLLMFVFDVYFLGVMLFCVLIGYVVYECCSGEWVIV